ncbi:hypothetical protein G5C51_01795 [Streptomyces sp. A7024]|uniref:DUF1269 domain-containing protein n=1 Tax=Streptomyces coryli TaxID=1128680 RepID=A0A6G4TU62_9ACTN|nr:DUF6325 family protein [Streptomyces coryli]NGN62638.1 hypothetical protein [Streptomyces coryli]
MEFGPVQILVVAFEDPKFTGEILPELRRLREHDIVRLIDLLVVSKADDGSLSTVEMSDLSQEESRELGSVVGALIGFAADGDEGVEAGPEAQREGVFTDAERWAVADTIPVGSAAAVALLEHRWAIPMRDMVHRAGGASLADGWVHPADLVAVGGDRTDSVPAPPDRA